MTPTPPSSTASPHYDLSIIGAGIAGLAAGTVVADLQQWEPLKFIFFDDGLLRISLKVKGSQEAAEYRTPMVANGHVGMPQRVALTTVLTLIAPTTQELSSLPAPARFAHFLERVGRCSSADGIASASCAMHQVSCTETSV